MTQALRVAVLITAVLVVFVCGAAGGEAAQKPLLTQEQAAERVRSLIGIPAGFELSEARRSDEAESNDEFFWPELIFTQNSENLAWWLTWINPDDTAICDEIRANVDAVNGDILAYISADEACSGNVIYTENDAIDLANAFLAKIQNPYALQYEQPIPEYENYESRRFYRVVYPRILDGISYESNRITVCVDARNGKIIYYDGTWTQNPKHPDFNGIISPERAEQAVLEHANQQGWDVIPPVDIELVMSGYSRVPEVTMSYYVIYQVYDEDGEPVDSFACIDAHPKPDGSLRIMRAGYPRGGGIKVRASEEDNTKPKKTPLPEVKLVWVRSLPGVSVNWLGKDGAKLKFRGQTYRLVPGSSVVDTLRKRVTSRSRIELVKGRLMVPEDLCRGLGIGLTL